MLCLPPVGTVCLLGAFWGHGCSQGAPPTGRLPWPIGAHMEHYTRDDLGSQGALSPGCFGFGHDGHSRDTNW